jgi:formate-dependent nitrite reductase membrane component NrfD
MQYISSVLVHSVAVVRTVVGCVVLTTTHTFKQLTQSQNFSTEADASSCFNAYQIIVCLYTVYCILYTVLLLHAHTGTEAYGG